jgi:hypothetical protein
VGLALSHSAFFKNPKSHLSYIKKEIKESIILETSLDRPSYQAIIYFIRKEKIYTKLKYSRCPQYDIVSGGIAALFSAFLGFLISEKFGLELLDSGDFYFFFMYVVFLIFAIRPFVKIININTNSYISISLKYSYSFFRSLTLIMLRSCLKYFKGKVIWVIKR